MDFRCTKGILGDATDPEKDADVIMTAAILGFAVDYVRTERKPIRFDMDPLDLKTEDPDPRKAQEYAEFSFVVWKIRRAINRLLDPDHLDSDVATVDRWFTPDYKNGGVIMGVYKLAGQTAPDSVAKPKLSQAGLILYDAIRYQWVQQYTGRGAYTGFVDNHNTEGDTMLIGPLPTARFKVPTPGSLNPDPHSRWLPRIDPFDPSKLWKKRLRKLVEVRESTNDGSIHYDTDARGVYVPWGLIGGDRAGEDPDPKEMNRDGAHNKADQTTDNMKYLGMIFVNPVGEDDIAAYTHGMIQAIYKAYYLGPKCVPYEIAVGDKTKKLASCIPCTLFMYAVGYPPTSIHLGRGESWAPLYQPYRHLDPSWQAPANDPGRKIICDLNNQWYEKCWEWLLEGVSILKLWGVCKPDHWSSRDALHDYLKLHEPNKETTDKSVAGVLILDALTIHDSEQKRIDRTLLDPVN